MKYFLRGVTTVTHYSDIVSDIKTWNYIWDIYIYILTFYLNFFPAFCLASIRTYFLAHMLTFFFAFYRAILAFFVASILASYLTFLLKANFARWLQTHTFSPANVASNGLGLFEPGSRGQTHVQSSQVDSNQCSILTFTILFYWHLF